MKRLIILLLMLLISQGCRTRKTAVQEEKSSVQESAQVLRESKQSNFEFNQSQKDYSLSSFGFGSNISLQSKDSTQPARITEYREGKPFRSIEVVNATYTENKSVKDSTESHLDKDLSQKYNSLKTLYSKQNLKLRELEKKQEQLKIEGAKLADNFKYLLWFLLLIAIIWIVERSGLFMLFKRLLKRV